LKQAVCKTESLERDNKFISHLIGVSMSLNNFNWILITSTSQHHSKWLPVGGQVQHNSIPNISSISDLPIQPRINATPSSSSLVSTQNTPVKHTSTSTPSVVAPFCITPGPETLGLSQGSFSSNRDRSCGPCYLPVPLRRRKMLVASGCGYRYPCFGLEIPIQRQAR
jgi:hypothetical protein